MSKLQRYQPPETPSRLTRFREAVRAYWLGPMLSSDPQAASFFGSGNRTASGVSVNEFTALNYAAVFAATNIISGDIASFPLMMYKREAGGKAKFDSNPLYRIVHDQPNSEMTSVVWRKVTQAHALTWGNGYSEIQRDGSGRAMALWPITPDRVTPFRRSSEAPLEYRVVNQDGRDTFIPAEDMIHIPGLGFEGTCGYSVIAKARESFGLGMAAEQFGNTLYGNGLAFGGVISYPGVRPAELSDKNYVASLKREHQGVANAHQILSLYNGAKYERSSIPPNDAQFLETRQFQISEVARWFNLPPHKLGDLERATHSNIEQQTIDYYTGTLLPWLTVWEQELLIKLVPNSERKIQFFEHVVDGLLRGDSAGRGELYSKRFNTASFTPNDIRRLENDNEIAGGDEAFVPLNMIPLSLAKPYFQAQIELTSAKAEQAKRPPPEPVKQEPTGPTPAEMKALEDALSVARKIAQDNEEAKDLATAQRTAAEQARDVALADVASLRTMTESLSLDVVAAQRSLDEARDGYAASVAKNASALTETERVIAEHVAEYAAVVTTLDAERVARGADVDRLTTYAAMIEADYTRVCAEKAEREATIAGLEAAVATATTTHTEALRALAAAHETEMATARAAREQVEQARDTADALVITVTRGSEDKDASIQELCGQIETLTADHVAEIALNAEASREALALVEQARDAALTAQTQAVELVTELRHAADVREAVLVELRARIETTAADLATSVLAIAEATEAKGRAETERDAAVTRRSEALASSEAMTLAAAGITGTLNLTKQALRGVLVEVSSRILTHQADRARKAHRGSAERFAQWIDAFFEAQPETCRELLRPAIRAWLIASEAETPLERALDRVVPFFVDDCARQLRGVLADLPNEDALPQQVERTVARWETERSETLADRIMKDVSWT